jgi:hypothetical protein
MARVHVMGGYLNVEGMSGGYPDNSLPGAEGDVDPGYGISSDRPSNPIVLPPPPPGIWPPPTGGNPIVPIGPDNTLPVQPGTIWPSPGRPPHVDAGLPVAPVRPGQPLPPSPGHPGGGPMPGGERPDNTLPGGQGGQIDNALPSKTYWMLCYSPSLGWKYVSVDPSLRPGMPLPPHAQPK